MRLYGHFTPMSVYRAEWNSGLGTTRYLNHYKRASKTGASTVMRVVRTWLRIVGLNRFTPKSSVNEGLSRYLRNGSVLCYFCFVTMSGL